MKKSFLILVFILTILQISKADTICYWHVYHNDELLKQFSEVYIYPEITILLDIENPDSLTTRFYKDTPCRDCPVTLLVKDDKGRIVQQIKKTGTTAPLTVDLLTLSRYNVKKNNNYLHFYYFEKDERLKVLLFKLKIY